MKVKIKIKTMNNSWTLHLHIHKKVFLNSGKKFEKVIIKC